MKDFIIKLFVIAIVALSCSNFALQQEQFDIGKFSISLAVSDIKKSMEFYKSLGFEPIEGAGKIEDKWIIMVNGSAKVGLFQGMFPENTITFNPTDARKIKRHLESEGIATTFEAGFEKPEGPCTLALTDPDGNSILIDQH